MLYPYKDTSLEEHPAQKPFSMEDADAAHTCASMTMFHRKLLKSSFVRMPVPKNTASGRMATMPWSPTTSFSAELMHHRPTVMHDTTTTVTCKHTHTLICMVGDFKRTTCTDSRCRESRLLASAVQCSELVCICVTKPKKNTTSGSWLPKRIGLKSSQKQGGNTE